MKQGLIGKKLSHSYSKTIHNIFYDLTDKKGEYELYEIESENKIEQFLIKCKKSKINNLNVTIPYKKEVMKYMDYISEDGKKINAINTIKIYKGEFYGYNSDYYGFIKTLEKEKIKVKGTKWIILGTGGASKSVVVALKDLGAVDIKLVSRTKKAADIINYDQLKSIKGYEGIINTTPVGMFPNIKESVVGNNIIKNYKYAIDLIYNPEITVFLQYAKNNGLVYANGMYMLVAQAVKAQEIWNDETYKDDIIENIYKKMVKQL